MKQPVLVLLLLALLQAMAGSGSAAEAPCAAAISGSGTSSYYTPSTGIDVSCGLPAVTAGEYSVAVSPAQWSGSAICGRCLEVVGPLGTVVARVRDECTGCTGQNLDLSAGAFAAIGNLLDGVIPVTWRSTPCPFSSPIKFYVDPGSNLFYLSLKVYEHRFGIASVQLRPTGGPSFLSMPRMGYNSFVQNGGPALNFPVTLRLTDVHGTSFDETMVSSSLVDGNVFTGTQQFSDPVCLTASVGPGANPGISGSTAAPNPFVGATQVRFTLAAEQHVAIDVFDAGGRRVRRLTEGSLPAGSHQVLWDGRNAADVRVPSGMYLVRISGAYEAHVVTVARVR